MNTSTSQIIWTCSSIMLGVLIPAQVFWLYSVDPVYARKKHVEGVNVLPFTYEKKNIVIVPKYVPGHAKPLGDWRCVRCSSEDFVVRKENRICKYCGESSYYEPEDLLATPTYRKFNDNSAKRVVHFKNWIARLQGKERCNITSENLDKIKSMLDIYPSSMTEYEKIRLAMRELKLQKYYNNVYYVMRHVYGYSLVEFRKINEARLVALFMRIQEPFSRIQGTRTNMLTYQYLIRKFCELLGYSLAKYIPLLKSRPNLQKQDMIWCKICDDLGLPFYPSV